MSTTGQSSSQAHRPNKRNPEHLRQISLGEEIENTSYAMIDRNRSFIPQVNGIVDSRDSLDRTPDSIDLTESPVKYTNT